MLQKSLNRKLHHYIVSFGVVNMFQSIENESGIKAVKEMLNVRENKNPPTECILEALRSCLE